MSRTIISGTLKKVGKRVMVNGWVHVRRNMGKIIFIDLRDRSGILQVVFLPMDKELLRQADELRPEFAVAISGTVQKRVPNAVNPKLPTGEIELLAEKLVILNASKTTPFELDKDTSGVNEELRLKYRYLDLRTERLKNNIIARHRIVKYVRDYLDGEGFLEIETPILTKGTPEGAREFLVPSRVHSGKFYVLPQSPQQFKQLLMVAGMEKYFQIARCFRDEDQRGDRQPEFTQMDLEMSFVEQGDVMALVEKMLVNLVEKMYPEKKIQKKPFPRLSYKEAMEKYGTDRPDLRQDKNDPNELAFCWVVDFPFFERVAKGNEAHGSAGSPQTSDEVWTFTHNPFSQAMPEHHEWLLEKKHIGEILTSQYDVVLNGFEIGGGSIRNHEPAALQKVFEIMGMDLDQIRGQFGHMLEAFDYGAPPHGGIAWGLDRLVAILQNEPNIREVIAFPKTGDARDVMMGAPSELPEKSLKEVHIQIKK